MRNGGGNGAGTANGSRSHGPPVIAAGAAEIADWNALLTAVSTRLRQSADTLPQSDASELPPAPVHRVRTSVLECVDALEQLHATLRHELGRRRLLELEIFDVQAALAQARAELAGTQGGERQARQLAAHDALTSLPNRGRFCERLEQVLGPQRPTQRRVAVLYIDLDGFKPINDRHGHAIGDQVLRIVAMRITRAVRADDMVGRLGGDEFGCLVADRRDRAQLSRLAAKLFDAIAAPLSVGELRLAVTPSIGIAMCPDDADATADLLRLADAAMYCAKRTQTGYAFHEAAEIVPSPSATRSRPDEPRA